MGIFLFAIINFYYTNKYKSIGTEEKSPTGSNTNEIKTNVQIILIGILPVITIVLFILSSSW